MKKSLLFFFLLFSFALSAQNMRTIDSLQQALKKEKVDTTRARILNWLSWEYGYGDAPKQLEYANELLSFSKRINYNWGIAAAYSNIAFYYENEGNLAEALKFRVLNVDMNEKYGSKKALANAYNNIANLYIYMREFDKGLEFYFKKVKIIKAIKPGDYKELLGSTYNNISVGFKDTKKYDSALYYLSIAKSYALDLKDSFLLSDVYTNTGMTYEDQKKYPDALRNYLIAQQIAQQTNYQKSYGLIYTCLADIYYYTKQYDKALEYAKKGIASSFSAGQQSRRLESYGTMERIYADMKNYEMQSVYLAKIIALKDSLVNDDRTEQLNNLRVKFETAEKEKENIILANELQIQSLRVSKSRYLISGLIGLFLIVALFTFLLLRQRSLKAQQRSIMLEQQLLRSQMNPHFIFNSLIAIESYIYKNEPREAGRYLSGFARLMRLILENSREEYIPLSKEIKTLEYYLQLQQHRFDDVFNYTINVQDDIDTETIAIPPMLAQPFIENAIEHGIRHSGKKGEISVHFYLKDKELYFEVEDNGIGFERSMAMKEQQQEHKSMATSITMERLIVLNAKRSKKIVLQVKDIKDEHGTVLGARLSFAIPYKEID